MSFGDLALLLGHVVTPDKFLTPFKPCSSPKTDQAHEGTVSLSSLRGLHGQDDVGGKAAPSLIHSVVVIVLLPFQ